MSDEKKPQPTSALERLRKLPEVFSLDELVEHTGFNRDQAKVYCQRWRDAGHIASLGFRKVGIYFNLVRNPAARMDRMEEAIRMAVGRRPLVVVGWAALKEAGWATQEYQHLDVACPVASGMPTLPAIDPGILDGGGDVRMQPRSARWFSRISLHATRAGSHDFLHAAPEMALADSLLSASREAHRQRNTHPVERIPLDDVQWPDAGAPARVRDALKSLGASPGEADLLVPPALDPPDTGTEMTL